MARWRSAFGVSALVAMAWVGCSSYDEATPDRTGDVDGGEAGAVTDATSDITVSADGAISDGGADGCAHDFCDDFEGVRMVRGNWSGFGVSSTMTAGLDAGAFVVTMQPADAAAQEIAGGGLFLQKPWSLTDAGGRRRAAFAFRAQVQCPELYVATVSIGLEEKIVDLMISRESGLCYVTVRQIFLPTSAYSSSPGVLVTENVWHSFQLVVSEAAPDAGGRASVVMDGVESSLDLTPTKEPTNFYTLFGIFTGGYYGQTAKVQFDDVTIDYLE